MKISTVTRVGTDGIIIALPMAFTRRDVETKGWLECRRQLLDNIQATYENVMDDEIKKLGWKEAK